MYLREINNLHAHLHNNWCDIGMNQTKCKDKMRRVLFLLAFIMVSLSVYSRKEIVLKSGTLIPVQSVNTVRATDVKIGQLIPFRVARDVNVNGVTAIPYGTAVYARVNNAKRSSWWGTKGRLGLSITDIVLPDGTVVPLGNGNFEVCGENRTAISVVLFCIVTIPTCFISGSRAEIKAGVDYPVNVFSDTTVSVE